MLRFRSESPEAGRGGARLRRSILAILLVGLGCVAVVTAAESGVQGDLGQRIHQRFRVWVEDETIRLRPVDGDSAIRSIALEDDEEEAAVNGKAFSAEELRAFLGKDGELVAELAALDAAERRAVLGLAVDTGEAPAEVGRGLIPPVPPMPPMPPVPPVPGIGHFRIQAEGDDRVSFGRSIEVAAGETAGDVVCIGCSITFAGEAEGDVVAVGGSVLIASGGTVQGNAVGVGGKVRLEAGATVEGDAVAVGGTLQVEDGATVEGQRSSVGWGDGFSGHDRGGWSFGHPFWFDSDFGDFFWGLLRALLLALLCCVSVLLARRSVEHTSRRLTDEPWKAIFAGLLTQLLFLPVLIFVTVILAVSIIGIPLLVLVPVAVLALIVATVLGFAAVAQSLGRWAAERFGWQLAEPFMPVVVGVAMIQGLTILARLIGLPGGFFGLFAFALVALGFFLKYAAWTMGLGAMTLSLLGRDWRRPSAELAAPTSAPPAPPAERHAESTPATDETAPATAEIETARSAAPKDEEEGA